MRVKKEIRLEMENKMTEIELWNEVKPILETQDMKELTKFRNKHNIFKESDS